MPGICKRGGLRKLTRERKSRLTRKTCGLQTVCSNPEAQIVQVFPELSPQRLAERNGTQVLPAQGNKY